MKANWVGILIVSKTLLFHLHFINTFVACSLQNNAEKPNLKEYGQGVQKLPTYEVEMDPNLSE